MSVDDYDDDECPICFQKMILPTAVPACGHTFCFLCIKGAAFREGEKTCPTCRGNISPSIFKKPILQGATLDMHDPESPSLAPKPARQTSSGCRRTNVDDDDTAPLSKKAKKEAAEKDNESSGEGPSDVSKQPDEEEKTGTDSEPKQAEPERFYWLYRAKSQGRGGWWRFDPRLEKDIEAGRSLTPDSTELVICGYAYVMDFVQMVQYRKDTPTRMRDIKRVSEEQFRAMSNNGELKGIAGVRVT